MAGGLASHLDHVVHNMADSEVELIRELRKRVIRASSAYVCCKSQENRVVGEISRLLTGILALISEGKPDSVLALAPAPILPGVITTTTTYPTISVVAGGALAVGSVVLISYAEISGLAQTLGATETLGAIGKAIGQMISNRQSECEKCVRKALLSQNNARRYETDRIRRRLG